MNNKKYRLFVFDFDGTLGDTGDCVVASFQGALEQNQLQQASREKIIHHMGLSLPQVFRSLTNEAYDNEIYDKLVADYRNLYRKYLTEKTKSFPGIKEALKHIKEMGGLCSIATSKKTEFAELSCKHLGLDPFIDLYIGDDKVKNKKPDPEMLHDTLDHFDGIAVDQAVMIGDATTDIIMGKAINMDTIAVTWGAHTRDALTEAEPTYIINHAKDLQTFV